MAKVTVRQANSKMEPTRPTVRAITTLRRAAHFERHAARGDHRVKTRRARFLTERDRDREAYALARAYLLDHGSPGVTDEVLQSYLSPTPRLAPRTMPEVFHRLLVSLRNRSMMATVISDSTVDSLRPVLEDFEPLKVSQRF